MSDDQIKELPCRRCGRVWQWYVTKKTIPYCPDGYGCSRVKEDDSADRIEELEAKCDALNDVLRQRDVRIEGLVQWHDALEAENEKLRKGLEVYERERNRYKHAYPEKTGAYFLAGGLGETDDNHLPQFVEIVPAYGCGWSILYEKTDRTIGYEGS